jgi:hypothetical protein
MTTLLQRGRALLVMLVAFAQWAPTLAQEDLAWHGYEDSEGALLFYGIPDSDYAPLVFSCSADSAGITFTYTMTPGDHAADGAADGMEQDVRLEAGSHQISLKMTGSRLELDDSFALEGRLPFDDQLGNLFATHGSLLVFVGDRAAEFPLKGADSAAAGFLAACRTMGS